MNDTRLTEREAEVVEHIVQGKKNKQVAHDMFLAEQTIKFHLSNIYRKLDVSSRYELIKWYSDGELAVARNSIKEALVRDVHELALSCAHEMAGYAVPVEEGQELVTIKRRLEQLEANCRSYARSLQALHRALDLAGEEVEKVYALARAGGDGP